MAPILPRLAPLVWKEQADNQVIADKTANPIFVASDLLSQAEHGTDSQVVLVAIDLSATLLSEIENQIDIQAKALPRVDIARQAIQKSLIVNVATLEEGVEFSNDYAPEHLILHLEDSAGCVEKIENAGSVFVGEFSPESYVPFLSSYRSFSSPFPSPIIVGPDEIVVVHQTSLLESCSWRHSLIVDAETTLPEPTTLYPRTVSPVNSLV